MSATRYGPTSHEVFVASNDANRTLRAALAEAETALRAAGDDLEEADCQDMYSGAIDGAKAARAAADRAKLAREGV